MVGLLLATPYELQRHLRQFDFATCLANTFVCQGCCQSTPRNHYESSVYVSGSGHADSSRAIAREPSEAVNPQASSPSVQSAHRHGHHRRQLAPSEHFNAPLRPHAWTSQRQWTRTQLDQEREAFFETRVTGRMEIWATLRTVIELMGQGDLPTAQSILDAAAITVPTGNLKNGAYDEAGNLYQFPEYVISDPQNIATEPTKDIFEESRHGASNKEDEIARRRDEKGNDVLKADDLIKVQARLSDRGGPDLIISVGKTQAVRTLTRKIVEEANVRSVVKLATLGDTDFGA